MMTVQQAFLKGLELVKGDGLPVSPKDIQVIAAHNVFTKVAAPVQHREGFDDEGPRYARMLILRAYAGKDA